MSCFRGGAVIMLRIRVAQGIMFGQQAPGVPDHPWNTSSAKPSFNAPPRFSPAPVLEPAKIYTLSEGVVVPLSADIHRTFTNPQHAVMHPPQTNLKAA